MANSNGTLSGTVLARETLKSMRNQFPIFSKIATNFSDQQLKLNQTLKVAIPTVGAAQAFGGSYATSDDMTDSQVDVVIDTHDYTTIKITDQEFSSTGRDLIAEHADLAARNLGDRAVAALVAKVTRAYFTNETVEAAADFGRADCAEIATALRKRSYAGNWAVLHPDTFLALSTDSTVFAPLSSTNATSATEYNEMIRLSGIDWMSWPTMSNPAATTYLQGFAGDRSALLFASAVPQLPTNDIPGRVSNITDPTTGMTIQVREWYDMAAATYYYTLTWYYGVAQGNAGALQRIVTQASS
jgi:hypothetical protein